jgi:hypothetical protein
LIENNREYSLRQPNFLLRCASSFLSLLAHIEEGVVKEIPVLKKVVCNLFLGALARLGFFSKIHWRNDGGWDWGNKVSVEVDEH